MLRQRVITALVLVALLLASLMSASRWPFALLTLAAACTKPTAPPTSTVPVSVTAVRRADVPLAIRATGTVEPIRSAIVQAQVSGQLAHVRFREGDNVEAGQILFEIDSRPFEAALTLARGPLTRDQSQYDNANRDLQRYQALAAKEFVTQQQLDQARSAVNSLWGSCAATALRSNRHG